MQFQFDPAYILLVDVNALGWNTVPNVNFKLNERLVRPDNSSYFDQGNLILKGKDAPQFWCFSVVFGYQPQSLEDGDGREEIPLTGGSPYTRLTGTPFGYSVIYLEAIRDDTFGAGRAAADPHPGDFSVAHLAALRRSELTNWVYGVIAHSVVFMESIRERVFFIVAPSHFTNASGAITLTGDYYNDLGAVTAHEIGHAPGGQSEEDDHLELLIMGIGDPTFQSFSPETIRRFRNAQHWTWRP